jgi:hypothetical protein
VINEEVAVKTVDTIKEKNMQALTKAAKLQKFQMMSSRRSSRQEVQDESHVSVGGMLAPG